MIAAASPTRLGQWTLKSPLPGSAGFRKAAPKLGAAFPMSGAGCIDRGMDPKKFKVALAAAKAALKAAEKPKSKPATAVPKSSGRSGAVAASKAPAAKKMGKAKGPAFGSAAWRKKYLGAKR